VSDQLEYVKLIHQHPNSEKTEQDELREMANRAGVTALLGLSSIGLATSVFLPLIFAHFSMSNRDMQRLGPITKPWYTRLKFQWLTLRVIWICSQLFYSACAFAIVLTPFLAGKIIIISLMGICWGVTTWAPMALVSMEIMRIQDNHATHELEAQAAEESRVATMLGINNVYTAAPQIFGLLASSVIFFFVKKAGATNAIPGTSWVLAMGGVASLLAAAVLHDIEDK